MSNIKNKNILLFDLDGTIIDSSEGIINSVIYSLEKLQYEIPNIEILKKFIGPPLEHSYKEYIKMNENEIQSAITHFKYNYNESGKYQLKLYEKIENVLNKLYDKYILYIATSKDEYKAIEILDRLNISKYFKKIVGEDFSGKRNDKTAVIKELLTLEKIEDKKSEIYMIGDTKFDIIGANNNNIKSIGVLYGFGTREELENENATHILEKVEDILKFFEK